MLLIALSGAQRARAQGTAPVPPDPEPAPANPKEKQAPRPTPTPGRKAVAPGFDSPSGADAEPQEDQPSAAPGRAAPGDAAPAGQAGQKRSRGRSTGLEPEETLDKDTPVSVPDTGPNEHLIQNMNAATGEVTLGQLLDEILADVIAEIDSRPAKWLSPMAIREVQLGGNVLPSYAQKLQSTITAQIQTGTKIKMVQCLECEATRTRIEGGKWIVSRGIGSADELREIGERLGVRAFMDVAFGFDPETGVLEMNFRVIRANDAHILWSDSFRADESTPQLMRSSEGPVKRKERLRDLEMLLEGRPFFGYVATAGFMILPHNDPIQGDIYGATAGYRIYERFGVDRRVMFGLDLTGFLNASRLAGAVVSAGSWWIPLRPDFVNPELRLGAKAGAFVAGTTGNAAVFQLGAEVILRYRFGLYAYVLFMTKSPFPPNSSYELGGVGAATGMSFNW